MKRIIALLLALVLCLTLVACGGSRRSNHSSDSKKGFVGSDGEYHPYIPEFGNDVNEWMENNW